ncbi:MAG: hypothetical protein J3Q66DRAFT_373771 [Benniella sp.]|nr:MAG: hypothetical protein J3Q66DRAFT_373771 [Benniella sp.]
MFLSYYSPPTFTLLTLTLAFIFYASFSFSILAQGYTPRPEFFKCSAFAEGQGLYLLGGEEGENFMLDFSVSWNTSDPVFKKIEGGPRVVGIACAMTNNGEDLFVISKGTGYVYNVKSSSWTVFQNANFASAYQESPALTDEETGFIYLPTGGENFAGNTVMLSVDLNTRTVNTTDLDLCTVKTNTIAETICNKTQSIHPAALQSVIVWSGLLRSFIFQVSSYYNEPFVFTPSQATDSTNGWSTWSTTGWDREIGVGIKCGAPAYGGSKVVYVASNDMDGKAESYLYVLDVAERTWKEGPRPPIFMQVQLSACAVSGDQFISWREGINDTFVYNLKTETWTSDYIAPTPMLSTSDSTSREKNLVKIILAATGGLLAVILTAISVYIGLSRKWKLMDTHDSGSDSSGVSSDHHYRPTWFPTRTLVDRKGFLDGYPIDRVLRDHGRCVMEVEIHEAKFTFEALWQKRVAVSRESYQIPPAFAQGFRPAPDYNKCSAFAEGQALYLLGGQNEENFILDLSVSWKTSNPVFKKIEGGPRVSGRACAMTNNGGELFVMSASTGYVYNVKSSSWTVFQNVNFTSIHQSAAVTDPETGFIYLPSGGENFAGREVMLSVDLKTGKVNTTELYRIPTVSIHPASTYAPVIWSELLRGFLIQLPLEPTFVFTPSKATNSTNGWSTFVTGQYPNDSGTFQCGVPAYGGSKMIFIATGQDFTTEGTFLYILDVAERTWKEGPRPPTYLVSNSCAVTGDQFISWGGGFAEASSIATNATFVYNIKTETWTSEYIAPSPIQSTSDSTSREKGLVNIILIVTGALLTIILTAISVYIGLSRGLEVDTENTSRNGSFEVFNDIFRKVSLDSGSDSSGVSSNRHNRRNWFTTRLLALGRLHQRSNGARPLSGDPHALLSDPTTSRSVQEGAVDVAFLVRHPHSLTFNITGVGTNDLKRIECSYLITVLTIGTKKWTIFPSANGEVLDDILVSYSFGVVEYQRKYRGGFVDERRLIDPFVAMAANGTTVHP